MSATFFPSVFPPNFLSTLPQGGRPSIVIEPFLGLIPILPLIGAVILGLLVCARSERQSLAGWIATFFAFCSFLLTVQLFRYVQDSNSVVSFQAWQWISVGALQVDFALRLDRLAGLMTLIVTGVGSLIHLYAIGYMSHDESRLRFFCYLNLFLFAMLLLVLGDNLLVMFVGWEGVGLCSYLLIGFWYKEMPNANAGQKAFVVNRIGDAGFLLGMFLLFLTTESLNFDAIAKSMGGVSPIIIETAALLLFIGAMGKSAQIPLYVWLPDAMAGPTPVSALIHAATMVTAGIYMVTRLSFLYTLAPVTLLIISVVGACTALFAATVALAQNDIKKVLAYSTVSQLGYMFMALGAGAFSNGIFHVVTHAFFKACLFMGAGSVIVGCHHEQDMRNFGGLWDKMAVTFVTYLLATFAIAGFPGLSGFYSKDWILWTVYSNPGLPSTITIGGVQLSHLLWGMGAFTAFLTAFYMTRSLVLTFFGKYRGHEHPHESPWSMTVPLSVLALLSVLFGYQYKYWIMEFLGQWTRSDMLANLHTLSDNDMYVHLEHLSIAIAVTGMALAFILYLFAPKVVASVSRTLPRLHSAILNKWYVDEAYDAMIVRPLGGMARFLFKFIDREVIDRTVHGPGVLVDVGQDLSRRVHTGQLGFYALFMFCSAIFFTLFWLVLR